MLHVVHLRTSFDERLNSSVGSFDCFRKLIHILGLNNSFEIIFENLGEIVWEGSVVMHRVRLLAQLTLKFAASEIFQDFLPVWWTIISSQIWLQLATQNLERSTLANTIGSHKPKYLSRSWHGEPVELEAIGGITMCDLSLQVGGQVDDMNCPERAFLRTDTTTNAKSF